MIVKLKQAARVALAEGEYNLPESEARRLLALGIAEPVNVSPAEEKPQETPKKRGRKKK